MNSMTKIGTCPRCFAPHAATEAGIIARPGWTERGRKVGQRGYGWQTGACPGGTAFEISAEDTRKALAEAREAEARVAALPAATPKNESYTARVEADRTNSARHLHLGQIRSYIAEASARIESWKPSEMLDRAAAIARQSAKVAEVQSTKRAQRQRRAAEKEARVAGRRERARASREALEAFVAQAAPGTVLTTSQLKKATGATPGQIEEMASWTTGKLRFQRGFNGFDWSGRYEIV